MLHTQSYIIAGFKVSGIEPFNLNAFNDDEFLASFVTDRPEPVNDGQLSASISSLAPDHSSHDLNSITPVQGSSGI